MEVYLKDGLAAFKGFEPVCSCYVSTTRVDRLGAEWIARPGKIIRRSAGLEISHNIIQKGVAFQPNRASVLRAMLKALAFLG
jgi:hypothetical protein